MAVAARAITEREQSYRSAPQNLEAEQALLGAILVNNEAFYRVSDFLEASHFFEPVHRRIYQVAGELIRANKIANPVTIKTFLPADLAIGDITLNQYLARLAAEATTIINAEDYGRSVYDLALRRSLIGIGEDMVNVAYDAPVEMSPKEQIEEAEKRLYEVAEKGQFDGGFQPFDSALLTAIDMASAAYKRDGHLSGLATGLAFLSSIQSKSGVYFVPGNGDEIMTKAIEHGQMPASFSEWRILMNESVDCGDFTLVGIDDPVRCRDDEAKAFRNVTDAKPVFVLTHFYAKKLLTKIGEERRVDFTFSSHTHGGQIGFGPIVRRIPYAHRSKYIAGLYRLDGGYLYVTRGVGVNLFPLRFFCRPEIAVFHLRGA